MAVKLLRELPAHERARFEREAQALAQIQHPDVVRYVAHGHTREGSPYLVMEWLEGEDLRSRLSRGTLSVHETVRLGRWSWIGHG